MGAIKQVDIRLQDLAAKELQGYWARYGDGKDGISAGLLMAAEVISTTAREMDIPVDDWAFLHGALLRAQELFRQQQREAEQANEMAHANGPGGLD